MGAGIKLSNSNLKNRNNAIDFYRYFFMVMICILHIKEYYGNPYPFGGAYLPVEFFFVLSGFFIMQHTYKSENSEHDNCEKEVFDYASDRYGRLFPQYIFSYLILATYFILTNKSTIKHIVVNCFWELWMLQIIGLGGFISRQMWYVSALLLVSVIVYYLLKKWKLFYLYIAAPLTSLVIYSYFFQRQGSLAGIGLTPNTLIVGDGVLRALAAINIGCICQQVYTYFKATITDRFNWISTIFELSAFIYFLYYFYGSGGKENDFILVIIFGMFVISVMCGNSYISRFLNKKFFGKLGEITYAMYCNHMIIRYIIVDFFPGYPFYAMLAFYIIIVTIFSFGTNLICKTLSMRLTQMGKHTKIK